MNGRKRANFRVKSTNSPETPEFSASATTRKWGRIGAGDVLMKVAASEELMRSTSGGLVASLGSLDIALPLSPNGPLRDQRNRGACRLAG